MKSLLIALGFVCLSSTYVFAGASGLSEAQISKVKAYYIENGTGDGDTYSIDSKKLMGAAAADFASLSLAPGCKQKQICPKAYAIVASGISTHAVGLNDDGDIYVDVFTSAGKKITSCNDLDGDDYGMICN